MDPNAAQVISERALPMPTEWTTRRVDADLIRAMDLILTMEARQRSLVVAAAPQTLGRTFVLQQFARFVAASDRPWRTEPAEAGPRVVEAGLQGRARVQPALHSEDVTDPVGRPLNAFRTCADTIDASFRTIFVAPRAG
jgi:protein-tyrosine-phosphatase